MLVAIKILQFKLFTGSTDLCIEHFDCITMNVDLIRYYTVYMNVHL